VDRPLGAVEGRRAMPETPVPVRAALVTGGARRIGRALSLALARTGYAVAVHAHRSRAEADSLAAEIATGGGRAAVVLADLADPAAATGLVTQAVAALGPLTLLVNNASIFEDDAVGSLDSAAWDRHFAVNLRAPVFLAEAFAAQAPVDCDACVVNIADQRILKLVPRQFSYTLTKAALHTATIMLAQALAPQVRVNAVAPGPTLASPRQDPAQFAAQAAAVPLGRGPRPEEIADAVLYLATATTVTGETIAVDGGQHLAWKTPDVWGVEE
jgi:NAD(P)-dependent dehydrogenase (short-subunit alcohol dehydrogenase family)